MKAQGYSPRWLKKEVLAPIDLSLSQMADEVGYDAGALLERTLCWCALGSQVRQVLFLQISETIVYCTILVHQDEILYDDDDFHFFRRPIWDEAKDWVLECAFHSQLRFIGGYFRLEVWNLLKASQCIILHVYQHLGNTSTPQRMLHALPSYLSESFYIFIHS